MSWIQSPPFFQGNYIRKAKFTLTIYKRKTSTSRNTSDTWGLQLRKGRLFLWEGGGRCGHLLFEVFRKVFCLFFSIWFRSRKFSHRSFEKPFKLYFWVFSEVFFKNVFTSLLMRNFLTENPWKSLLKECNKCFKILNFCIFWKFTSLGLLNVTFFTQ